MNAKQALLPCDDSGHVHWLMYLRLWPIAVGIIVAAVWSVGRMETPAQKQDRIDRSLTPVIDRIDALLAPVVGTIARWDDAGGHPLVVARVNNLEGIILAMHQDVMTRRAAEVEQTEILRELKDAIVGYLERQPR